VLTRCASLGVKVKVTVSGFFAYKVFALLDARLTDALGSVLSIVTSCVDPVVIVFRFPALSVKVSEYCTRPSFTVGAGVVKVTDELDVPLVTGKDPFDARVVPAAFFIVTLAVLVRFVSLGVKVSVTVLGFFARVVIALFDATLRAVVVGNVLSIVTVCVAPLVMVFEFPAESVSVIEYCTKPSFAVADGVANVTEEFAVPLVTVTDALSTNFVVPAASLRVTYAVPTKCASLGVKVKVTVLGFFAYKVFALFDDRLTDALGSVSSIVTVCVAPVVIVFEFPASSVSVIEYCTSPSFAVSEGVVNVIEESVVPLDTVTDALFTNFVVPTASLSVT
jgi:hypothetical protein